MKVPENISRIIFCIIVVLHVNVSAQTVCVNNNLSPQNEPEDSPEFQEFSDKLEQITGFSDFIVNVNCPKADCKVNSNGGAIWQARSDFYSKFMMNSLDDDMKPKSLDGCLCFSEDEESFKTCMAELRKNMTESIDSILIPSFKQIVENNSCALFAENCVE